MPTEIWAVLLVISATLIGALGPIYVKKGSTNFVLNLKVLLTNYNLMLGVFMYVVATMMFIPALRGGDLSILYPLVSITYIWVSFLSIKFLKEKMNKYKWSVIILIMMGVALIGIGA